MAEPHFSAAELRAKLARARATLTENRLAALTRKGYAFDWRTYERFCSSIAECALPSSAETLALFITEQIERLKVNTVARRVAAVAKMHQQAGLPSPVTLEARDLLACARRLKHDPLRQVRPLAIEELRKMSAALQDRGRKADVRNRAVLLVGFASALRSANLVMLNLADVEFTPQGVLLTIRSSKTDQAGAGEVIGVPHGKHPETCPVKALQDWLKERGPAPGPLFSRVLRNRRFDGTALAAEQINRIIQQAVKLIGLDHTLYGSHSGRAGLVTTAAEAGVSELIIASQTLHKNLKMIQRYFRRVNVFRCNPCNSIDL